MLRAALISTLLAGCGRISIDPVGGHDGTAGDDSPGSDGGSDTGSDGGGSGSDEPGVCGDTTCSGGETCKSCATDCKTAANVCGNGECGPGEDSTSCVTDCGPTPRPWDSDEVDLLARINTVRASGITCPMGTVYAPGGPQLTMSSTVRKAAQDWAWEHAHQQTTGFTPCNRADWNNVAFINGPADNTARMTNLTTNDGNCVQTFNPSFTTAGVGIAIDQSNALVLLYN